MRCRRGCDSASRYLLCALRLRVGQLYAVASPLLSLIESAIRPFHELGKLLVRSRQYRDAYADCRGEFRRETGKFKSARRLPQPLGYPLRGFRRCFRKNDREFLAADAAEQ